MPTRLVSDSDAAQPIRCILSDVDGVMTDGRIIFDTAGVETKQFHVRDGLGIKRWIGAGLRFAIVTARQSSVVQRRAEELGIADVAQGVDNKLEHVGQWLDRWQLDWSAACYIGDDLADVPAMRKVGLAVAPADAAQDARESAHWVLRSGGGQGAVRELTERLLRAKSLWSPPEAPS